MTDNEKMYYEKLSLMNDKKEQKRIANLQKYDNYLDNHNASISQLSIR